MNDQRTVVQSEDADLEQIAGAIDAQEQRDIIIAGSVRDGDEIAQGVPDVLVRDVMAVSAGSGRRLQSSMSSAS
jgi:hypothetical protein